MVRRKSTRRKQTSRLTVLFWTVLTLISGGGIGGYLNPDWPILGSLLSSLRTEQINQADQAEDGLATNSAQASSPFNPTSPAGSASPGRLTSTNSGASTTQISSQPVARETLLIATFNIQVFGVSKMSKPGVVELLAQIVRQFDVVAIQEIRAKDDGILPRFVQAVNADGSRYDFIIGPRLGRTVSTEQYAFVFDTTRLEYDPSSVGTMSDPNDVLHREPLASRFRVRTNGMQPGFSFWLVNIHTDPDEVPQEISALADAFTVMQSADPAEDDVILLGDLNANESQLGRIAQIPGIRWVVRGNVMTNTRKNRAYDNIIFHGERTNEFTGRWGVIDLEAAFGIDRQQALQVSDHLPVWAEFDALEAKSGVMASGQLNRR